MATARYRDGCYILTISLHTMCAPPNHYSTLEINHKAAAEFYGAGGYYECDEEEGLAATTGNNYRVLWYPTSRDLVD